MVAPQRAAPGQLPVARARCECAWLRRAAARWCCCVMAFRSYGAPGGASSPLSPLPAIGLRRPTCAATAVLTRPSGDRFEQRHEGEVQHHEPVFGVVDDPSSRCCLHRLRSPRRSPARHGRASPLAKARAATARRGPSGAHPQSATHDCECPRHHLERQSAIAPRANAYLKD